MVQVIPFARLAARQTTHRRLRAIGRDHQLRADPTAVGQFDLPARAIALERLQRCIAEQLDLAPGAQGVEQRILHHAILDDMPSASACTDAAEK